MKAYLRALKKTYNREGYSYTEGMRYFAKLHKERLFTFNLLKENSCLYISNEVSWIWHIKWLNPICLENEQWLLDFNEREEEDGV